MNSEMKNRCSLAWAFVRRSTVVLAISLIAIARAPAADLQVTAPSEPSRDKPAGAERACR